MAEWGTMKKTTQQKKMSKLKDFDEDEDLMMKMMMLSSQKPGIDLIQNCDLPPPMKVFSGSDNKTVITSMSRKKTCSPNSFVRIAANQNHDEFDVEDDKDGKMGLLRALRLSQTRAREAEAKCAAVSHERDLIVVGYMQDSMQLFAYRQLVRLLELQVSELQQQKQKQKQKQEFCDFEESAKEDDEEDDGGSGSSELTWIMALAFCFGIAGFGFALGCKYYTF